MTTSPKPDNAISISPELAAKIEKARSEYSTRESLSFTSAAEAQQWMDELESH